MNNVSLAIELLIAIVNQAQKIGAALQTAKNENRDLTAEEIAVFVGADDAAKKALQDAIDAAKAA